MQQALKLVQFVRECNEVMFWIHDKEAFVTSEEFGQDLEHVEVLQKKFDEFQKVGSIVNVCQIALSIPFIILHK